MKEEAAPNFERPLMTDMLWLWAVPRSKVVPMWEWFFAALSLG